ncbi:hypothetical protein DXG03_008685 [Asterophora parasitica]|uniref:Peroxin/Ferlin domain-containing protein n=1 Tax=Asterophora parasitica TaxID=117018 RepID=A0A9P7G598_9AGAR|nr:hypothetical protein DXG03_008685 [Asterophora parasitica]
MLLSSTLPPSSSGPKEKDIGSANSPLLLTTKDPLSLPTTSANFKRFVSKAGPIFWFQDRVEEVVMWRRGWRVTGVWMAAYAFLYTHDFIQPHVHHLLLSPAHIPPTPTSHPISSQTQPSSPYPPYVLLALVITFPPLVLLLSSPFFPARIVCLVAGLAPLIATHPRVRPLLLPLSQFASTSAITIAQQAITILAERYRTFRVFVSKLGLANSRTQPQLSPERVVLPPLQTILERLKDDDRLDDVCWRAEMREVELWENERYTRRPGPGVDPSPRSSIDGTAGLPSYPHGHDIDPHVSALQQQQIRHTRSAPDATDAKHATELHRLSLPAHPSILTHPVPHPADAAWSKTNLRPGERRAWTRGRDGWGGIQPRRRAGSDGSVEKQDNRDREGAEEDLETEGAVSATLLTSPVPNSSNLTFSLAPGWAFVNTEGWRRDRTRSWADFDDNFALPYSGPDVDGWVYTNDVWGDAHPAPYPGSVTRRRKWVRRVWFDGSQQATVQTQA